MGSNSTTKIVIDYSTWQLDITCPAKTYLLVATRRRSGRGRLLAIPADKALGSWLLPAFIQ